MRLHNSLRRLAGLAVVEPRGDRAGAGARPRRRRRGLHRDERERQRRAGLRRRPPTARSRPGASYLTGGAGTGAAGLGSQGALAIERGWLLAVNAGSNDVSAFRVRGDHLVLVNRVPSGGTTPNSVTIHDGVAYVLNTGGTGNISGFKLRRHGLVPLDGSTQPLSTATAGAVQVSFTPRGDQLVVSEKGVNTIVTYPGRPLGPRRSGHGARLGRSGAVRLLVRQARRPQRHRGRRERAHLVPARPVRADHGLARERPGRGLLGGLDEQRPLHLHRQRRDRLHLRLLAGVERDALARHAGRRHGSAGRGHASARRGDLARPLPLRQRRQHRPDQRIQDRRRTAR